uniref:C-type lectin domain family 4 member F n=1 Tax=Anthurium amnicola TaxID=1678845 RepID=A0A1D1ZC96_9ARAE
MKSKTNGTVQRSHNLKQAQVDGPNWMLIVGGALLSTLSIRLGWKLKQAFAIKQPDNTRNTLKDGKSAVRRRPEACQLHSKLYCFGQDEDSGYHYHSEMSEARLDMKRPPTSPMSKEGDPDLPLVAISVTECTKDNAGAMWASSPEYLELPPKPFHHSNTSDSPCVSESGSDIFSKREVIHKLRRQLKRRDEMILEMQTQITDLQKSLAAQMAQSANLQSQLDCTNRELFDSEREIQRLRKAIADHCVADAGSPKKPAISSSPSGMVNGHANGYANGYADSINNLEFNYVGSEKGRDSERVEMLKREVGELKEVIEGKEFLLQSYKEQKAELGTKVKELQLRLASQVPNIL